MNFVESFVRNPVKVAVGVLMVALFGVISAARLPIQLTPEVSRPTLTIETRWPGASPQEVEREIVNEQEEQLKGVEGVVKMTSESTDSSGRIILEFAVGTDMNEALVVVNTRLAQVPEYPVDAREPTIATANSSDTPIAWFVLSPRLPSRTEIEQLKQQHPQLSETLDRIAAPNNPSVRLMRAREAAARHPELNVLLPGESIEVDELKTFAEDYIEARFERVPGVANSNVFGGREREMQVIVDSQKLAARAITIVDLRRALAERNRDVSAGDFWEGKRRYVVRTLGQFDSPEEVGGALIAHRGGRPVYVRDVARVAFGYKKPDGEVQRFGTVVLAMNVLRESGANVLVVMEGLRETTRELNEQLLHPRGLELTQVYDETEYIHSSLNLVRQNIYVGGALTILALLLFLRSGRTTLVIALAIPTSLVGAFLVLKLLGRTLNVISLAGLAFAVGMLVDNAVVVLENIFRHHQMGKRPFKAAVVGTQEVWGAVIASTLTTLAVFLPVLFIQEEAGQLFRDIAIAISASVGLSMLVSAIVIPTATARILKPAAPGDASSGGRFKRTLAAIARPFDAIGRSTVNAIVGTNDWLLRRLWRQFAVVAALVGGAIALGWALIPRVEYLPTGNRNLVFGIMLPPPGYNLETMREMGRRIETELRPYWDVDPERLEDWDLPFPAIGDMFYVAYGRQVFFGMRAVDPLRGGDLVALMQTFAFSIPGTIGVAKQSSIFEQGLTGGRTIDVEIGGPSLEQLVGIGGRIMGQVQGVIPGAQAFPVPSLDLSSPEVHILPKWDKAAEVQLTAADLGYAVNALVDGAYAEDYYTGGQKIDLTIVGGEDYRGRTQDLESLAIATASGALVPLGAVADIAISSGPEQVNRRERQRAVTIQVSPPPNVALEDAMDRIEGEIVGPLRDSGALGQARITLSGTADKLLATWRALRFNFILALLITYLLMAALFESWLHPMVIIAAVPLGAVGGLLGLSALNLYLAPTGAVQTLDVLTMLGFVILIGTVVNNPILIVHQSLNHMREDKMDERTAILASVRTRIRPIFMTTTTTVLGLTPLALFPGAGSELYRGLGSVVLGGLALSTVLTLALVPSLFMLAVRMKRGVTAGLRIGEGEVEAGAEGAGS